jgi:type III secretion protein D
MHQGARVPLQRSGLAIIGSADDCDLILLDSGVAARHAAVTVRERDLTLRAIDGQIDVDGRSIAPGEIATLIAGTPIVIGSAKIVIGEDPTPPAESASDEAAPQSRAADESNAASNPGPSPQPNEAAGARGFTKLLYTYAPWTRTARGKGIAAVVLACLIAGVFYAATFALPTKIATRGAATEERVTRLLTALKLQNEIQVSSPQPGVFVLTGTAPDDAAHSDLVRALAAEDLSPVLRLTIGSQLASAVKDVFRVNGFTIDARYSHGGVVVVSGVSESNRHVAPVLEHALRDIQGLNAIRFGEGRTLVSRAGMAQPQSRQIGVGSKRVVSIVEGEPAYIVTSDGARYFVGATLPEGHRVLGISKGSVILERDGERMVMTF